MKWQYCGPELVSKGVARGEGTVVRRTSPFTRCVAALPLLVALKAFPGQRPGTARPTTARF